MRNRTYDVEADWQLLNTCNYRCGYCFFGPELLGEKLVQYAQADEWTAAFDATGLTWLLHLTGGEPSIYPKFVELCDALTKRHFISLNSNLSHPAWLDFARRVDPLRVNFINAGLHYDERQTRQGFDAFAKHFAALLDANFSIFVSVVATPQVLAEPARITNWLDRQDIVAFPKMIRGFYQGQTYPQDYSKAERVTFKAMAARARKANGPRLAAWREQPSIDVMNDGAMLDGIDHFTGQSCAAGQKFISLRENGDAFRCSDKQSLGNILDGSLALQPGPAPCDTNYCPYFCKKYTSMVPKDERPSKLLNAKWLRASVSRSLKNLSALLVQD